MREPHAHVGLRSDLNVDSAAASVFVARTLERGLPMVKLDDWPTSSRTLEHLGEPAFRVVAEGREHVLIDREDELLAVSLFGGHVSATVAAAQPQQAAATLAWLREQLPPPDPSAAHEVTVTFWTYSPHGPHPTGGRSESRSGTRSAPTTARAPAAASSRS